MIQNALAAGVALAVAGAPLAAAEAAAAAPELPPPFATPSAVNFSKLIGWPEGKTPEAPSGFTVSLYADGLDYPRWLYVLPNGDVLVAEARTEPDKLSGVTDAEALRGASRSPATSARAPTGSPSCGTATATVGPRSGKPSLKT